MYLPDGTNPLSPRGGGPSLLLCGAALPAILTAHRPDLAGEVILWDFRFGASESRFSRQNFHVTMLGSCEWPYFLSFGPNLCTARGKIGADLQQEAKHETGRGLILLSLMTTCVTSPPPAQLLDSMRCSRIPPIKPHFCRSEHELDFCPLKAKGQSPAP